MKILVLAWDIPATSRMPGSPRLFNLCRVLSRNHRMTLAAFSLSDERYQSFLNDGGAEGVFDEIVILDSPRSPNWWNRQIHRFSGEPYFVTRHLAPAHHANQCRTIRRLLEEKAFDVIYADGLVMAQYVMDTESDSPAIIDLHDSLTLLFSRAIRAEPHWLMKLSLYLTTRGVERWERTLSRRFNAIITNSRVDASFLESLDRSANVVQIDNGVDTEFFKPVASEGDSTRLVFTGVMNYAPNEDAAVYFCESILPAIRKRHSKVEFWIVGKDPTERVWRLKEHPGVHVTGGVADVRPFLATAGVFVCPLRFGSGVKNKILAALAMRKIVVATRVSLEGLDLREGEHVLVADDANTFAAQVSRLIEDPDSAANIGRRGQEFVEGRYSWETSAKLVEQVLQEAVMAGRRHAEPADV